MVDNDVFREQLATLREKFQTETITLNEAVKVTGISRDTLLNDRGFPKKKTCGRWFIPIISLARWLTKV